MPKFIRVLKKKLINIYNYGKDCTKTVDELNERCTKMKTLLKDLRQYNRVLVRDYERFLDEIQRQLQAQVRSSSNLERAAYIEKTREKSIKFQKEIIPFVRDQGYQGKDPKTGLIKTEGGKTVSEYMKLIFNI
jgi:hypothetical protein